MNPTEPVCIQSQRLTLRSIGSEDAEFLLNLFNDESFIRYIGDRGIRDVQQASRYIDNMQQKNHGTHNQLLVVSRRSDKQAIGICSFLKREELDNPDIGFAFLPEFRGQGYALEATRATLSHVRNLPGVNRVVAISSPDNARSISLLKKLGYRLDREIKIGSQPDDCSVLLVPADNHEPPP